MEPYDAPKSEQPAATSSHQAEGGTLERLLVSAFYWFIHGVVSLALLLVFVLVVPRFLHLFEEFGVDLPAMTVAVVTLSRGSVKFWFLFVFAFLFIDTVIAIAVSFLPQRLQWVTRLWFWGYLLLAILLLLITGISLAIPYMNLMTNLSTIIW